MRTCPGSDPGYSPHESRDRSRARYPHAAPSFKLSACALRSHSRHRCDARRAASAANVAPIELVLRQIEVPPGYQLDEDNSFAIPNAYLAAKPEGRRMVARTGRLSGYYARYTNYGSAASPRWRYVNSAADVFRRPDGRGGVPDLVRQADQKRADRARQAHFGDIGTTARVYSSSSADDGTVVIWRYSRVVASVRCQEMTAPSEARDRARANQQQRIAAALR